MKYTTRQIQEALAARGFDPGPIDGQLGPLTKRAISAFKRWIGYRERPYVGPLTAAALFEGRVDCLRATDETHYADPLWLKLARTYLGLREYKGSRHNKKILEWWETIRAPFTDDETPWCAGFVGGCLEESGIRSTRSAAARSYERWSHGVPAPYVGAIVVFWRGKRTGWSGHVGFVVGRDQHGHLMVIGGNQGNAVTIKPFGLGRVLSYRMPTGHQMPLTGFNSLPIVNSNGRVSTNEA